MLYSTVLRYLKQWLKISPRNAVTVLDTHDGIGVIDIGPDNANPQDHPGLIPSKELDALVERIHTNSHGQSRLATGAAASNLDLYQVNCTFYDALGRNDRGYLLARAIQVVLAHSDLQLRTTAALHNPTAEQHERMMVVFDMLVRFERAYLVAYKSAMSPTEARRWNSWDDYMREWCRRDDFHNALPSLLRGEDPAFQACIRRVDAEARGAPDR